MTEIRNRKGFFLALVGPTGSGKTTFARRLLADFENDIRPSISYTSRAKRPSEVEGEDYFFVENKNFLELRDQSFFFESEEVHGNWYGTPMAPLEQVQAGEFDMVLDIDIQGALVFKERFPDKTALVFLAPPSVEALVKRVSARGGTSATDLKRRIKTARREYRRFFEALDSITKPDFLVINDELETAYKQVRSIYISEGLRVAKASRNHLEKVLCLDEIDSELLALEKAGDV